MWILLWLLLGSSLAWGANTHGTPDQAKEMQAWFGDALAGYVVSGCLPASSGTTTTGTFACTAYVKPSSGELVYVTQATKTVGPLSGGNGTYWIAVHRDLSTAVSGWTRQAGTHYLWQLSATQPSTPANGLLIARVVVAGGAIAASGISGMGSPHPVPLTTIADETDVRQDGAKCDSSTDDTQAFVRAHARGKPLRIPVGTCVIDTVPLANAERLVLRGNGQGRSILQHKASATGPMFAGPAAASAVSHFELRSLTLDGNQANQSDWELDVIDMRADTLLIDGVECKNSKRSCLDLHEFTYVARIQNNWFHDMSVHGGSAGQDTFAVLIGKESSTQPGPFDAVIYVQNNRVEMTTAPVGAGNSAGGIFFSPTDTFPLRAIVTHNTLVRIGQGGAHGNYIGAIDCYRECDHMLVQGNRIFHSYQHQIRVQRSTNVQILDNLISGEQSMDTGGIQAAIGVSNRSTSTAEQRTVISRNIIQNSPTHLQCITAFYDASATPMTDVLVEGNVCDTTGGGIYLTETSGTLIVRGNLVQTLAKTTDFKSSGIAILNHYGPRILLEGNTLKNIQQRGIFFDDGTPRTVAVTVRDNHIEDVGLTLGAGAGQIVLRNISKLLLTGNVWTVVAAPSADRLFDLATIPYVGIFDNQAPASPTLTYGANVGSTQYKTRGNTWSNDGGTVTLDGTTPTAVTFGTAEKDALYRVSVTCDEDETEVWVTGKATTGFNIQTSHASHDADCDWVLNR